MAGLSYFHSKAEASASGGGYNVTVDGGSDGALGLNLGFGGQMSLSENLFASAELKYQIFSNLNQFVPSLSLMYKF